MEQVKEKINNELGKRLCNLISIKESDYVHNHVHKQVYIQTWDQVHNQVYHQIYEDIFFNLEYMIKINTWNK